MISVCVSGVAVPSLFSRSHLPRQSNTGTEHGSNPNGTINPSRSASATCWWTQPWQPVVPEPHRATMLAGLCLTSGSAALRS